MRCAKQFWPLPSVGPFCLAVVFSCAGSLLGCQETTYEFFAQGGQGIGGGSGCSDDSCASGGQSTGGSTPVTGGTGGSDAGGTTSGGGVGAMAGAPSGGSGGTPSGGSGGTTGELGPNCESPKRDVIVERLQLVVSGLCVAPGAYAPISGERAFQVALVECEESLSQSWTIQLLTDSLGGTEFRNEDLNLNLDTYRAEPNDGTPMVLYAPFRFANQRFSVLEGPDDTFKLAPLHAPTKCLTESEDALVLMTCETELTAQDFRRIGCR